MKLPLARYRYSFRMAQRLRLPDYAGALLRGQFGAALRQLSCMTGASKCTGCMLLATCPYPAVFETPAPAEHAMQRFSHVPNPYVVEAPPIGTEEVEEGQLLRFNLVLFGGALDQLPLISLALQKALEQGLGTDGERARGKLESIELQQWSGVANAEAEWLPLWQSGDTAIRPHQDALPDPFPAATAAAAPVHALRLHFHSPLRLQHQGTPVRSAQLTPRKFVADLLRRATLVAEFHAGQPTAVANLQVLLQQAEALQHDKALHWFKCSRYSSRQGQQIPLDGLVGEWTWRGEMQALLPWLQLGQWLHVGKSTIMGLGGYRLELLSA